MHLHQQFTLQNILPLLILLRVLIRLVILPTHSLLALSALDVSDEMFAGGHAALAGFGLDDVDDVLEEESFAVLAAEVLVRRSVVSVVL